jgi:hypothetical protein
MAGFFDKANQALMNRLAEDAGKRRRQVQYKDLVDMRGRMQSGKESEIGSLAQELYGGLGKDYGMDVAGYETALAGRMQGDPIVGAGVGQYMRDKSAAVAESDWYRRLLNAASQDTGRGMAIRGAGVGAAAAGATAALTPAGQSLIALMGYLQQGQQAAAERENELV